MTGRRTIELNKEYVDFDVFILIEVADETLLLELLIAGCPEAACNVDNFAN